MKKFLPVLSAAQLFLAACSGSNVTPPTPSPAVASITVPNSRIANSSASPSSISATSEPATAQELAGNLAPAEQAPVATQPAHDSIFPGGQDLSDVSYANGGTCTAAICGYGSDANGNPNPSSGEIQTIHGCQEGYITNASLCDAVKTKAHQYGW